MGSINLAVLHVIALWNLLMNVMKNYIYKLLFPILIRIRKLDSASKGVELNGKSYETKLLGLALVLEFDALKWIRTIAKYELTSDGIFFFRRIKMYKNRFNNNLHMKQKLRSFIIMNTHLKIQTLLLVLII